MLIARSCLFFPGEAREGQFKVMQVRVPRLDTTAAD
jgi:hypothetical protein